MFGFHRLLRQWKGRMANLVAHSRARDTSTRSICPRIHITCTPTQGSIPFSATQSLGLCLPFQCYSGGVEKKSNPLALSVRLMHTLGLSSRLRPHFHSKNSSTKTAEAYTTISRSGIDENRLGSQKQICKWVKQPP